METIAPTFKLGDTIRIELKVADEDGIGGVGARFRLEREGSPTSFYVEGHITTEIHVIEGVEATTALIEMDVTQAMASGRYTCEYVTLTDSLGNQSLIVDPGIEFDVEGAKENNEGPALTGWQFATA